MRPAVRRHRRVGGFRCQNAVFSVGKTRTRGTGARTRGLDETGPPRLGRRSVDCRTDFRRRLPAVVARPQPTHARTRVNAFSKTSGTRTLFGARETTTVSAAAAAAVCGLRTDRFFNTHEKSDHGPYNSFLRFFRFNKSDCGRVRRR